MKIFDDLRDQDIAQCLKAGEVGILRTDTLYGLVCVATNQQAVERIFALKSRDERKSPIVLVSNSTQLFDTPSASEVAVLNQVWPGKTSVIVHSNTAPAWIERGNNSVAYRLPDSEQLQQLINITGPLIAPSANPQGEQPARSAQEAIKYFGENVDFYVDSGKVADMQPSALIRILGNGTFERLR